MNTVILPARDPLALQRAIEILHLGGLVAFPTDTVYGVGALAFNGQAVESIYVAKGRSEEKAIPVLIGDPEDLAKVSAEIPEIAVRLAAHFWPGPLTLVVPKHPGLPKVISASSTVGVRIPDHPVARALLRMAGPMAVTSANLSDKPSSTTAAGSLCPTRRADRLDPRRWQNTGWSPFHCGGLCWCRIAGFACWAYFRTGNPGSCRSKQLIPHNFMFQSGYSHLIFSNLRLNLYSSHSYLEEYNKIKFSSLNKPRRD